MICLDYVPRPEQGAEHAIDQRMRNEVSAIERRRVAQGCGEAAISDVVIIVGHAFTHIFGMQAMEMIEQFGDTLLIECVADDEEAIAVERGQVAFKLV